MFIILNRLRGTKGYWSHITGSIIAVLLYLVFNDLVLSLSVGIGYIAGESMGWGKWIGGMMSKNYGSPTDQQIQILEGRDNGIHWLANIISNERYNYYNYCFSALTIRGMYWWILTLLPFAVLGYVSYTDFLVAVIALGFMFPLSVILGGYTTKKFNFTTRYYNMNGTWEHAEVWYGLGQDIIIWSMLLLISI